MRNYSLVNCVAASDVDRLVDLLGHDRFHVLRLHGAGVVDKMSFLARAAADLPAVEGIEPHNWDALADHLWNVLYELTDDDVALVWTDAHGMARGDLCDFLDAVRVVSDVSRQVAAAEDGFPRAVRFLLFLVGEGPEYRPLPV